MIELRRLAWLLPSALAALATRGAWQRPPHLALLEKKLLDVAAGRTRRLMVSMPPRHGKSETISKFFVAWFLGLHPDKRVILASYEAEFAASWGRKARDVLTEWGPELYGVTVRQDSSAANRWEIEGRQGGMVTAGVGGPITGRGADLLVIDDPVKNAEDAASETMREKAWDWWRSTAYTRLEPAAACIVIMTRWHEDDLAGRLRKESGEEWETLDLPALAEEDDPLGRKPGEALWPARYDEKAFEKIQATAGSYYWSALYQQRPAPAEGNVFKRSMLRHYQEPFPGVFELEAGRRFNLSGLERFLTVDLAASEKTEADYTVVSAWGRTGDGRLLLLDLERDRLQGPDLRPTIQRMHEVWKTDAVWIETVGFQLTVAQGCRRDVYLADGTALKALPVREVTRAGRDKEKNKFAGDKVSRGWAALPFFEAGRLWIPGPTVARATWVGDFVSELLSFPKGAHDDQVDTALDAVAVCGERSDLSVFEGPKPPPKPDEFAGLTVRDPWRG